MKGNSLKRILDLLLFINLIIVIILFFFRNTLPSPSYIDNQIKQAPLQTSTYKQPFYVATKNSTFYIKPLYDYQLYGLVVSKYNARRNYMARLDKYLNITDICIIWGNNAFSGVFKKISFYSGEFTCFTSFNDQRTYQAWQNNEPKSFKTDQISNNHLITGNIKLGERLRDIHIGDQIYITGYLANYGLSPQQIIRTTSTSRTDKGNGACETLYVTSFTTLKYNPYRQMFNYSFFSFCGLFMLWLAYELSPYTWKNNPEITY